MAKKPFEVGARKSHVSLFIRLLAANYNAPGGPDQAQD
jgi:hypothetical protein